MEVLTYLFVVLLIVGAVWGLIDYLIAIDFNVWTFIADISFFQP